MSATALKEQLRADLKAAMQAKAADDVRVLRALIAALDNAEAVPGGALTEKYVPRAFGDSSGEVARRELDAAAVESVLQAEIASRLAAAEDYERHGRDDDGARLRAEAGIIASYSIAKP